MHVIIIGAGFTGLAAARELNRQGHKVTVIDRENQAGGLASGFKSENWDWPLERHYHHVFETDRAILSLAREVGIPVTFSAPVTATYYGGKISRLDTPRSLLNFSALGFIDRLRTGLGLALLKYNPFWQLFEGVTAKKYILSVMGASSWQVIWEPLFTGKFGSYADTVSATWFWARIYTRSPHLGYPEGGFSTLAGAVSADLRHSGCELLLNQTVKKISRTGSGFILSLESGRELPADKVLCTLPYKAFTAITAGLPEGYVHDLNSRAGLGAVTLILALREKFLPGVYWLNINDRSMPFLAVVEHTAMLDKSRYGGDNLLYIGNYLPRGHRYFSMTAADLIKEFAPYLTKINPAFSVKSIRRSWVWSAPFAQPVFTPPGAARTIPDTQTPIPGLYLACIQQVYPWDRGINYAVELGYRAAAAILR